MQIDYISWRVEVLIGEEDVLPSWNLCSFIVRISCTIKSIATRGSWSHQPATRSNPDLRTRLIHIMILSWTMETGLQKWWKMKYTYLWKWEKRRTKEKLKWQKDSSPILNIFVTDSVLKKKKKDIHLTVKLMLIWFPYSPIPVILILGPWHNKLITSAVEFL